MGAIYKAVDNNGVLELQSVVDTPDEDYLVKPINPDDAIVVTLPSKSSNSSEQYTATKDCWLNTIIYHSGSTNTGDFTYIRDSTNTKTIAASSFSGYGGNGDVAGPVYLKKGTTVTLVWNGYDGSLSGRTLQYTVFGCL